MFLILILNILKDLKTPTLISLPVNFCSGIMASRRSKDKTPATDNQIVKKELASLLNIVIRFTTLGTIPKPNYSSILASTYDPYALTNVHQSVSLPSLPTLCPLPLLPMLCPFPPLWYQSHSFLADDNVVVFSISLSVSIRNFDIPLLFPSYHRWHHPSSKVNS